MEMVTLNNGKSEGEAVVFATMFSLTRMLEQEPQVFYEFVCKCRDPQYSMWGDSAARAVRWGLLDASDYVHESVRNVTLSAVAGEGMDLHLLSSPIRASEGV